jgi:hypothetical protein
VSFHAVSANNPVLFAPAVAIFRKSRSARAMTLTQTDVAEVTQTNGIAAAIEVRFRPRLYCRGEQSMTFLKAVLKALSDS